jgi:hypothetical protein
MQLQSGLIRLFSDYPLGKKELPIFKLQIIFQKTLMYFSNSLPLLFLITKTIYADHLFRMYLGLCILRFMKSITLLNTQYYFGIYIYKGLDKTFSFKSFRHKLVHHVVCIFHFENKAH